jgi:hypothetical protein
MTTFAARMSAGSTKLQVAAASVAVVAAATLTPAVVHAAPNVSFAPISEVGNSFGTIFELPGGNSATPGDVQSAAASEAGAFAVDPITGLVQFFGQIAVGTLSFISGIIYVVSDVVYRTAAGIATALGLPVPIPPYQR